LVLVSEDQKVVHVLKPSQFGYGRAGEKIEAFGFPYDVGPSQKLDSAIRQENYTLNLTQQSIDGLDFQVLLDQREGEIASIQLPGEQSRLDVPTVGPYTVTVPGLTIDQVCFATVLSDTDPLYLNQVTGAGVVAAGTFKITADTVTFHGTQAGATIAFYYLETKTGTKIIGATATPSSYGSCSFKGIIKGTRTKKHIWFPRVVYTRDFEQTIGDTSEISLAYDVLTPAAWNQPYAFWDAA
jgi:hypothetical protein